MSGRKNINWTGLAALANVSIARFYFTVRDANANKVQRKLSASTAGQSGPAARTRREWPIDAVQSPDSKLADCELVGSASPMPNLDAYISFYYTFSLWFNIYYAIKHLIIILLDLETFCHLRYLDCYLLGRLSLNARVVGMANLFACFISGSHVVWALMLQSKPRKFHMSFLAFLMHSDQEVAFWDDGYSMRAQDAQSSQSKRSQNGGSFEEPSAYYSSLFHYLSQPKRAILATPSQVLVRLNSRSTLIERQPQAECLSQGDLCKLRPNRSLECWRKLGKASNTFNVFCLALATSLSLALWWWAVPLLLFQRGFELSYGHCVRYIAGQKAANAGSVDLWIDHQLIFDPPDARHYQTPERPLNVMSVFRNYTLVPINWYHTTRLLVCSFELLVFYSELSASFASKASIFIMMTSDICNYSAAINRRLVRLIQNLRLLSAPAGGGRLKDAKYQRLKRASLEQIERDARQNTAELQAMIGDMFELIDNYNRCASIQASFLVLLWLSYSALVSGWLFLPRDNLPKAEWYLLHGFATFYLLIAMTAFARVRHSCMRMHENISSAMALDQDFRGSKATWLALLRFYKPTPMYCFTIQRNVEMSLLFALKLIAWLFTALSVVASIFIFRSSP